MFKYAVLLPFPMRRKIIKQGIGGHTIFLPIHWIRKYNLKPGDEVELYEKDHDLIVHGEKQPHCKQKELFLEKTETMSQIRTIIASAYKAGYDEIILHFNEKQSLHELNKLVNTFTGLEIVSQTSDHIKIKSFLQATDEYVEDLIIKLFQMIKVLFQQIKEARGTIEVKELSVSRRQIQKLRDHCLRIIHATTYKNDQSYDYYDLVTQLEKLSADICSLGEYISHINIKDTTLFLQLFEQFSHMYTLYLKKDFNLSNKYWLHQRKQLQDISTPASLRKLIKNHDEGFALHYYYILNRYLHLNSRMVSLSS